MVSRISSRCMPSKGIAADVAQAQAVDHGDHGREHRPLVDVGRDHVHEGHGRLPHASRPT